MRTIDVSILIVEPFVFSYYYFYHFYSLLLLQGRLPQQGTECAQRQRVAQLGRLAGQEPGDHLGGPTALGGVRCKPATKPPHAAMACHDQPESLECNVRVEAVVARRVSLWGLGPWKPSGLGAWASWECVMMRTRGTWDLSKLARWHGPNMG